MSLQIIHSQQGMPEYVLLPIKIYPELRSEIEKKLKASPEDYVPFVLEKQAKQLLWLNPPNLGFLKSHFL